MPAMPRMDDKSKKIAFKILGTPPNMRDQHKKSHDKINKRLVFEETLKVR